MVSSLYFRARCVGESPPAYGSRKAYSCVPPGFEGPCSLHYELDGQAFVTEFSGYSQALTAATVAIFSLRHDFQYVIIRASDQTSVVRLRTTLQAWKSMFA